MLALGAFEAHTNGYVIMTKSTSSRNYSSAFVSVKPFEQHVLFGLKGAKEGICLAETFKNA